MASWLVHSSPDRAVQGSSPSLGHCVVFLGKTLFVDTITNELESSKGVVLSKVVKSNSGTHLWICARAPFAHSKITLLLKNILSLVSFAYDVRVFNLEIQFMYISFFRSRVLEFSLLDVL